MLTIREAPARKNRLIQSVFGGLGGVQVWRGLKFLCPSAEVLAAQKRVCRGAP